MLNAALCQEITLWSLDPDSKCIYLCLTGINLWATFLVSLSFIFFHTCKLLIIEGDSIK